jgi:hypothetical protein
MEEMSAIFGNISHRMKKGAILLLKEFVEERLLTLLYLAPSLQNWFGMEGDTLYLHSGGMYLVSPRSLLSRNSTGGRLKISNSWRG